MGQEILSTPLQGAAFNFGFGFMFLASFFGYAFFLQAWRKILRKWRLPTPIIDLVILINLIICMSIGSIVPAIVWRNIKGVDPTYDSIGLVVSGLFFSIVFVGNWRFVKELFNRKGLD